jgi:ATP adenylyltransferase
MDILRAPWRMTYIDSSSEEKRGDNKSKECIFCLYPRKDLDEENLILYRGKCAFVILNRYPYSNGHLMVVPYRHTAIFPSLTGDEKLEIMSLAQASSEVLQKTMKPDGFNIGINLGRASGAGIDSHLHMHIVPRWDGDTNFMSVTAETKVLPEALIVTRKRLLQTWNDMRNF